MLEALFKLICVSLFLLPNTVLSQEIGLSWGDDQFIQLSGPNSSLSGSVSKFDIKEGFIHSPVTGSFSSDKTKLTVDFQDFGQVSFKKENKFGNIAYKLKDTEALPPILLGYTARTDKVATDFLEYFGKNVKQRTESFETFSERAAATTALCLLDETDGIVAQIKSAVCSDWDAPLSLGIVTPRSSLAGWQAVAAAMGTATKIRTIDKNDAVLVSNARLFATVSNATDTSLFDGTFDARGTKVITGFEARSAEETQAASLFFRQPNYTFLFEGEILGESSIFKSVAQVPIDEEEVNSLLNEVIEFFSAHNHCEFSSDPGPIFFCLHHSQDRVADTPSMWVISAHPLKVFEAREKMFVQSDPYFATAYQQSYDEAVFGPFDDRDDKSVKAVREAICLWQIGANRAYPQGVRFNTAACK